VENALEISKYTNGFIVLTGGAGFIGANILHKLNQLGLSNIIVVDNLKNPAKIKNITSASYVAYYDKAQFLAVLPTLTNIKLILHQGACSSTTETDIEYLNKNNVEFSKTLLHYAINNSIDFVFASSASVYGNGESGFSDLHNDYTPINDYARSKLVFDQYVTKLLQQNPVQSKVIGLRYFNVFGFREAHKEEMSSVVNKFFLSYQANKTIRLFEGSNNILRDFIYVDDIVNINIFCMSQAIANGIYNAGTGKAQSFQDLANAFTKYYKDTIIEYTPFPEHLKGKYQFFTEAIMNKLHDAGYANQFITLDAAVHNYLKLLENEEVS
jgi:ADP-L-glycero-D-manno-heptose 6-epimerase